MDNEWFKARWRNLMNNIVQLEEPTGSQRPAVVCMSYASSFGKATRDMLAAQGEMEMSTEMVTVGILRGIRLQIMQALSLTDDQVYLDCDNFLKEPGTQISGKRVLNDNWRALYFTALGQAKVMVIFLTEGYFESQFCTSEITAALQVSANQLSRGTAL